VNGLFCHIDCYKKSVLFIFLLVLIVPVFGGIPNAKDSVDLDRVYEKFMHYVYDFSFRKADSILLDLESNHNEDIFVPTMKSNFAWWALLSGYNVDDNVDKCGSQTTKTIKYISGLDKPDINQQLDLIEAYILKVRLENYVDSKVKAIPLLFKALNRIKDLINDDEISDRKRLILGLYYYFVDYIDEKYMLAGPILNQYPKGDREKGLKYLQDCLNSENHLVQVEANYFLYKIYFSIENNYRLAFKNIRFLRNLYPDNMVFNYEMYKTMKENKDVGAELFKQRILNQINDSNSLVYSQKNHFIKLLNDYKD